MADEGKIPLDPPEAKVIPQAQPATAQNIQLSVITSDMTTTYANFFRVTGTFEEVMLDFGLHSGLMTNNGPEAIRVTDRLVLSFPTAKRLLAALQMSIARHEQMFGAIEIDPQKKIRPQSR